jgi:hypothetical protein
LEDISMKINSSFKVLFDLFMLVLLVIVYCAQPTGIPFHEYAGLAVYIFFIVHLLYNYKWIVNVGKKLFDKSTAAKIRFMYLIDFLLVISFVLIGISGIMISHVIFTFNKMPLWRPMHTLASAISVVLIGIHIGLHGKMIMNIVKEKIKIPFIISKVIIAGVFVILLAFGIFGIIESKTKPVQNIVTQRSQYETVVGIFERSINLINGPPEYVRNRMANNNAGNEGGNRGNRTGGNNEFQGPQLQAFNGFTLFVSASNYFVFIIICGIIAYIITLVKKKREV